MVIVEVGKHEKCLKKKLGLGEKISANTDTEIEPWFLFLIRKPGLAL